MTSIVVFAIVWLFICQNKYLKNHMKKLKGGTHAIVTKRKSEFNIDTLLSAL